MRYTSFYVGLALLISAALVNFLAKPLIQKITGQENEKKTLTLKLICFGIVLISLPLVLDIIVF